MTRIETAQGSFLVKEAYEDIKKLLILGQFMELTEIYKNITEWVKSSDRTKEETIILNISQIVKITKLNE